LIESAFSPCLGSGAFAAAIPSASTDQQQLIQTSVSLLADRIAAACGGQ
jgi:hypothetical protein